VYLSLPHLEIGGERKKEEVATLGGGMEWLQRRASS
jgi:hypothetical protein